MRLSNSELMALLKRALEGSGWKNGRYEEAAYAIWWLESRGVGWLDNLANVWPRLVQTFVPTPELTKDHTANCVINANLSSLLYCGPNSIDLAFANAYSENLVSVETRNCLDRIMILPGLAVLAKRGASATARWHSNDSLHVASILAGDRYPTYLQYAVPPVQRPKDHSLFLTCSLNHDGVNHFRRTMSKLTETHDIIKELPPEHFKLRADESLANGIFVPQKSIDILERAANRILVKTTEQSRMRDG